MSWWHSIYQALSSTRHSISQRMKALFQGPVDATVLAQLEKIFLEADFGIALTRELIASVSTYMASQQTKDLPSLLMHIEKLLLASMPPQNMSLSPFSVILITGINGSGKTTSLAKLAHLYKQQGKKVTLAAADTFRAAAQEQLNIWAQKLEVHIVRSHYQGDPAAVAFDAITAAQARQHDLVLIDTAGRLDNKTHLLGELAKIQRSCHKAYPSAPHEIWLVIDATMGQNALAQVKSFLDAVPISGFILTKMDGTARGGIALALQKHYQIPVLFIGIGEGLDDLVPFQAHQFIQSLFAD